MCAATPPLGVDDRELASGGAGVRRGQPRERFLGADPGCEKLERLGPVGHPHAGLGRHGADAGTGPGHQRSNSEEVGLDGDAQLAGFAVTGNDRIGHPTIVRT